MNIDASIFRAYDIRGIVADALTPAACEQIGRAFGSEALARGQKVVNLARDGRLSGPDLITSLAKVGILYSVRVSRIYISVW